MRIDLESSLFTSRQDANQSMALGRWSGMIPMILKLGSPDPDDEFDLTKLDELFAMGMIDGSGDEHCPMLTTFGLAVYDYLIRL